jgi:hypothetical protein
MIRQLHESVEQVPELASSAVIVARAARQLWEEALAELERKRASCRGRRALAFSPDTIRSLGSTIM